MKFKPFAAFFAQFLISVALLTAQNDQIFTGTFDFGKNLAFFYDQVATVSDDHYVIQGLAGEIMHNIDPQFIVMKMVQSEWVKVQTANGLSDQLQSYECWVFLEKSQFADIIPERVRSNAPPTVIQARDRVQLVLKFYDYDDFGTPRFDAVFVRKL